MKLFDCVKCGASAYMAMSIHNYCARFEVCDNRGEWKATEVEAAKDWNRRNMKGRANATISQPHRVARRIAENTEATDPPHGAVR